MVGCFLIGVGFALVGRNIISPSFRLLFMTGFLGGLTTFSTYALENADLFRNTEITIALLNVKIQYA